MKLHCVKNIGGLVFMMVRKRFGVLVFFLLPFIFFACEYESKTIVISFESNGGSFVSSQYVKKGDRSTEPESVREGYVFDGWYTSTNDGAVLDERWAFTSSVVQHDMTLYAKWIPKTYEITFDVSGAGEEDEPDGVIVTYDQPYGELPTLNRIGHTFLGWSKDLNEPILIETDTIVEEASNHVLFAIWQINQYTITFINNNGSLIAPITQEYGTEVVEPIPERLGHTFLGWFQQEHLTDPYVFDRMPGEDITLHAKWQVNQYTITFDSQGGSPVANITEDYNTVLIEPEPTKVGYTFMGWYADEDFQEIHVFNRMPSEDITLYALWHNTITFESNEGSHIEPITRRSGTAIEAPEVPTKEGYTFTGWFMDEELTEQFVFTKMPEPNMTLYARWEINQYTVTFETGGIDSLNPVTLDYGSTLSVYQPSGGDHIFLGWFLEETFETEIIVVPSADIVVYARWGHEVVDVVQVGEKGQTYTIPTGVDDDGTATVYGGYLMATTETTYELWYEVISWAEDFNYHFKHPGKEGSSGYPGLAPSEDKKHEPVTHVSWRDVIVWLNAVSEMNGFDPVYRTEDGAIIRDSRDTNGDVVDAAIQTTHNGYRLPTSDEWEMAARWRSDGDDASIFVGGRYWTPGSFASGATADTYNENANNDVAWYALNSNQRTHVVGEKAPNHLGLYDMSGNVWEWAYDRYPGEDDAYRIMRGGSYHAYSSNLQIGILSHYYLFNGMSNRGFRMTRSA
jgi:uncharacterized repeat protein (TIGR02543 family)